MSKRASEFDNNEESDFKRKILNENDQLCIALFRNISSSSSLQDFSRRDYDPIGKTLIIGILISTLKKMLLLFHHHNSNTVIKKDNVWTR